MLFSACALPAGDSSTNSVAGLHALIRAPSANAWEFVRLGSIRTTPTRLRLGLGHADRHGYTGRMVNIYRSAPGWATTQTVLLLQQNGFTPRVAGSGVTENITVASSGGSAAV